jgi:hypothetical protein
MGSREDDAYWDDKYAGEWFADEDPSCDTHGEDEMYYSHTEGEHYCLACQTEDEKLKGEDG